MVILRSLARILSSNNIPFLPTGCREFESRLPAPSLPGPRLSLRGSHVSGDPAALQRGVPAELRSVPLTNLGMA